MALSTLSLFIGSMSSCPGQLLTYLKVQSLSERATWGHEQSHFLFLTFHSIGIGIGTNLFCGRPNSLPTFNDYRPHLSHSRILRPNGAIPLRGRMFRRNIFPSPCVSRRSGPDSYPVRDEDLDVIFTRHLGWRGRDELKGALT